MHIKTASSFVLLAALLAAGIARADTPVYKWVDDQGKVHYSTEPHGDKAQQLAIQNTATPHAGTGVTPVPGASTDPGANDTKLVLPQPADSPECKGARSILLKYMTSTRLYSVDDKGNKVTVSPEERLKALAEARNYVQQSCGGGA